MPYFDSALIPGRRVKLDAYKDFSKKIAEVYREYGATRVIDCVLDPEAGDPAEFHAADAREALEGVSLRDFAMAAAA